MVDVSRVCNVAGNVGHWYLLRIAENLPTVPTDSLHTENEIVSSWDMPGPFWPLYLVRSYAAISQ